MPHSKRKPFRNAIKWAYVMTLGQRGIALVLTFFLAAILGPRAFGVVAMAMAFVLFIEMLVAQGMGAAIIQRKDLNEDHLDSVFWLIMGAAVILAGVSVILSPWWAAVNDLPELTAVIRVLSLSIPIKGLTVVQQALLQRKMDFRSLALLTGISSILGGAVGVTMAIAGFGVWSLVAQQLVDSAAATTIMWAVSKWRPRMRFSVRHARELLGFSGGVFASQLGVYVAAQADAILMGIFFGPVAVGLYRIADRLMRVLLEVTTRSIQIVALPHFSSLQDDPERLKTAVLSCIRLSATITVPAMALLAVAGKPLMALLGEEWAAATMVLRVVVILGAVKAVTLFTGPLLWAKGRARTAAALVWLLSASTAAGITLVGMRLADAVTDQQVLAVAAVRTALFVVLHGLASVVITLRLCRLSLRHLGAVLVPPACAALAALFAAAVITLATPSNLPSHLISLALMTIPPAALAAITLIALDHRLRGCLRNMINQTALFGTASPPRAASASEN